MAEVGSLFVRIASKFDAKGINAAVSRLDEVKRRTQNISRGFKIAGAALTGFAMAGGASILNLTKKASKLEETTAKFNTVFIGQQKLAEEWAQTLVQSYGVSTEEARRFLGSIQDLLVPMGMHKDAAGKLSNEIVKLSVDLGSFNNMPTEKVMLDIQSALVGNFETMKKYGVVLNATRVEQEIMNQGWAKSKDEITTSMKAQAAYNLVVMGSQAALGDFNRTSTGYANQVKIMTAKISDLQARLGDKLIPTMKKIVGLVISFTSRLQKLKPETVSLIAKILLMTVAIAGILGPLALLIGFLPQLAIGFAVVKGAMLAFSAAMGPVGWIIMGIGAALGVLAIAWSKDWGGIQSWTKKTIFAISEYIKALWKTIKEYFALIGDTFGLLAKIIRNPFKAKKYLTEWVDRAKGAANTAKDAFVNAYETIKEKSWETKEQQIADVQEVADKTIETQQITNMQLEAMQLEKAEKDIEQIFSITNLTLKQQQIRLEAAQSRYAKDTKAYKAYAKAILKIEGDKLAKMLEGSEKWTDAVMSGIQKVADTEKLTWKSGVVAFKEALKERLKQFVLEKIQELIAAKIAALAKAIFNATITFGAAAGQIGIVLGAAAAGIAGLKAISSFDMPGVVPGPIGKPVLVQALGGEKFGGRQSIGTPSIMVNVTGNTILDDAQAEHLADVISEKIHDRIKEQRSV